MISEVVMPQMGAEMEEGTIIRWMKREGDSVERGEIIAEIETDKANVEIEAFESGTFRKILAGEGETLAVGTVIAIIAAPDDDISQYERAGVTVRTVEAVQPEAATPHVEVEREKAAQTAASRDGRVRASPVARKLAQKQGIDLAKLQGTGPGGRIVLRDVEAALEQVPTAQAEAPPPATPAATAPEAVTMSRMRQAIARRMALSKREAPHYYLTLDVDMAEAQRLRRQINSASDEESHVSINDLIVKASAVALARHPAFNTWLVDGEVRRHQAINVCVAIALEDGLIAPAILDCGSKTLIQVAQAGRNLADRARSGKLKPEEYSEGTFTVSNLGMFEVESLVAIIQPPQTAILGVGAVRAAAVVRDGQVTAGELMKVALSADHRATDGAQGAQFLNEIRRLLENPLALLA